MAGGLAAVAAALITSVSRSATFQTFVGAADAAAALARIHDRVAPWPTNGQEYTAAELAALYPCAVVDVGEYGGTNTGVGAWAARFKAIVTLCEACPTKANLQTAVKDLRSTGSAILDELQDSASPNDSGCLIFDSSDCDGPFIPEDYEEEGNPLPVCLDIYLLRR